MQADILKILAQGPATTGEIAAALDRDSSDGVSATLNQMRKRGKVRARSVAMPDRPRGPRITTMWEASP